MARGLELTKERKAILRDMGVPERDFEQIQRAMRCTTYKLYNDEHGHSGGEKISAEEAVKLLGERKYMSGLARSAFHYDAWRLTEDGRGMMIDSTKLFK